MLLELNEAAVQSHFFGEVECVRRDHTRLCCSMYSVGHYFCIPYSLIFFFF